MDSPTGGGNLCNVISREASSTFLVEEGWIFSTRLEPKVMRFESQGLFLYSEWAESDELGFLLFLNLRVGNVFMLQVQLQIEKLIDGIFSKTSGGI
jgi:hypothetical protein